MTESFEQISAHNEELARDIVERASARGVTVSTAESLTAGMIASTIADIPGASAVLRGGAVTYCDEIKHRVLGVEQETLDRYTAVSHQTAREMASGSLELYQSDIAVSATGYAGPGGGTEDDPAGTFYIGSAQSPRPALPHRRNDVPSQYRKCQQDRPQYHRRGRHNPLRSLQYLSLIHI